MYKLIIMLSIASLVSFYPVLTSREGREMPRNQEFRGGDQFHHGNVNPGYYNMHPNYNTGVNKGAAYERGVNQGALEGAAAGSGSTTNIYTTPPAPTNPGAPYQLAPSSSYN